MKDYLKVLEIAESVMSKKARHNAYVKIKIRTHDEELVRKISIRLKYGECYDLINYCNTQIRKKEPTWMVAARKADWGPNVKTDKGTATHQAS